MNKVILMGRIVRDAEVRYAQADNSMAIARFTLAVDRRQKTDNGNNADFISCVAFGKTAEFLEKYGLKGTKFVVTGRIQTGSYDNRDGQKVYTTDVVVEEVEFAESKSASGSQPASQGTQQAARQSSARQSKPAPSPADGFMNIPDGIDEELPFN